MKKMGNESGQKHNLSLVRTEPTTSVLCEDSICNVVVSFLYLIWLLKIEMVHAEQHDVPTCATHESKTHLKRQVR